MKLFKPKYTQSRKVARYCQKPIHEQKQLPSLQQYVVHEKKIYIHDETVANEFDQIKKEIILIRYMMKNISDDIDQMKKDLESNIPDGMT